MEETQEMWVQSLGGEDPVEEEMSTHSNILAWKILWTEEPGGLLHGAAKSWTWLSDLSTLTKKSRCRTDRSTSLRKDAAEFLALLPVTQFSIPLGTGISLRQILCVRLLKMAIGTARLTWSV